MNNDCIYTIYKILDTNHILKSSLISKQYYYNKNSIMIWKKKFTNKFYNIRCNKHWYEKYKTYYVLDKFLIKYVKQNVNYVIAINEIDLSYNILQTIPSEIGHLTMLKYLFLNNNDLQTIPSEIGQLTNLQLLYISENQKHLLPSTINKNIITIK